MKRKLLLQDSDSNYLSILHNGTLGFLIGAEDDIDTVAVGYMTKEEALQVAADIVEFVGGNTEVDDTVKIACRRRDGVTIACCTGTDEDINEFYGGVQVKEVPFRVVTPAAIQSMKDLQGMKTALQAQVDLTDNKIKEFKGC